MKCYHKAISEKKTKMSRTCFNKAIEKKKPICWKQTEMECGSPYKDTYYINCIIPVLTTTLIRDDKINRVTLATFYPRSSSFTY